MSAKAQEKEHKHLKEALKACWYPDWTFVKTATKSRGTVGVKGKKSKHNIVIPYVPGVAEKLRRIFNKHLIPVFFKPINIIGQKPVYPKDHKPKHKKSDLVYAVQCNEKCTDPYNRETK